MIPSNWITEEVFIHFILKVWGNHDDFTQAWQRGNVATEVSACCSVSVKSWFISRTTKLRSSQLGRIKKYPIWLPNQSLWKIRTSAKLVELVVIPCHCYRKQNIHCYRKQNVRSHLTGYDSGQMNMPCFVSCFNKKLFTPVYDCFSNAFSGQNEIQCSPTLQQLS